MCMAGDAASANSERTRAEEGGEEEEDAEEVVLDYADDEDDFPQPETNMTLAPPLLWPPPLDVDEDEAVTEATQDDLQIGYLQISDDPSIQNDGDGREGGVDVGINSLIADIGALGGGATNGHAGSLAGAVVSDGRNPLERIVTVNGMQFHVYGNVSGLDLLTSNNPMHDEDLDMPDSEEEEEEERRRAAVERAMEEAIAADAARRAAPIPPERRAMIVNAMRGIKLEGFRPSWADSVSEDQWMKKVKESITSAPK